MDNNETATTRKRSLTELTLTWLAERVRKAEQIKEQIAEGRYEVDSEKVAASLMNDDR